jgi:uncharacterized protein (DUF885 family)
MFAIRVLAGGLALLLSSCAFLAPADVGTAEDETLRRLLERSEEGHLEHNPMEAIYRGLDRRVVRIGSVFSDADVASSREAASSELQQLATIERAQLSPAGRIAYDTLRWNKELERRRYGRPLADVWLRLPLSSWYESWQLDFPSVSTGDDLAPFRTVVHYEDGLSRIADYVTLLDRAVERMREGLATGVTQPRSVAEKMVEQFDAAIAQGVERSSLYGPILRLPEALAPPDRQRLADAYATMIRERVLPALVRTRDFLKNEYLPQLPDGVGLSRLPGGAAYYQQLIAEHTSTWMRPGELHDLGRAEVARIERGMEDVIGGLGFTGSRHRFFEHIRSDRRFKVESAQALADGYRAIGRRVDATAPVLFDRFPKAALELRPVPADVETASGHAYYNPGTPDGRRPGVFYFNTYRLEQRTVETMEALYLHEAVPGHHLESNLRRENAMLPNLLRFGWNTAYTEGWALYAEGLGPALGLYTDPYQRFGAYSQEMLRAVRLVVDTGLHALGWSREQAIDYMLARLPSGKEVLAQEVDRYIANPGQALAYKVGELTILRLRAEAERELGPSFDIRRFHDQVLNTGVIPMAVLEAKVAAWIDATRGR